MSNFDFNKYCLDKLFSSIPEIKSIKGELQEELQRALHKGYGAHIIYEDIFSYFISDFINKKSDLTEEEKQIVERSFKLIEELAHHEDFEVRCVVEVSFIEPLLDKIKPMKKIEEYILPKSLEMAREVVRERYELDPITWEKDNKIGSLT
jgi:hypothetical protein